MSSMEAETNYRPAQVEADARLIARLGGPAVVSRMLGFKKASGTQRVNNWTTRGIPAAVKVRFPHIFMRQEIGLDDADDADDTSRAECSEAETA